MAGSNQPSYLGKVEQHIQITSAPAFVIVKKVHDGLDALRSVVRYAYFQRLSDIDGVLHNFPL